MKSRNLEEVKREVEAIRDSLDEPIDKKIKNLVIGLRRWGIDTEGSCQGHFFHGFPYPWIDVSLESLNDLAQLIGLHWWNVPPGGGRKPAAVKQTWVLKPIGTFLRIFPENKSRWQLWKLQRESGEFGKFLQEIPDDFFERRE